MREDGEGMEERRTWEEQGDDVVDLPQEEEGATCAGCQTEGAAMGGEADDPGEERAPVMHGGARKGTRLGTMGLGWSRERAAMERGAAAASRKWRAAATRGRRK